MIPETLMRILVAVVTVVSLAMKQVPQPDVYYLSDSDFAFISAVVEAESDRSAPPDGEATTLGRIYIAACILNRIESDYFPDTAEQVLTQSGQFSTVQGGYSVCSATEWSDEAVRQAIVMLQNDEIPHNILFFNCVGFNNGTPYYNPETGGSTIGGNYFMTYGG